MLLAMTIIAAFKIGNGFAGFGFLRTVISTYSTPHSNFALAYGGKTATATRSELRVRTDKSFVANEAILVLRGRAAWAHHYNPNRDLTATFQTLPGASLVVNGAAQARNAALTAASAEMNEWLGGRCDV